MQKKSSTDAKMSLTHKQTVFFLFFFLFSNVQWLKCVQAWNKSLFAQLPRRHPCGGQIEETFLWCCSGFCIQSNDPMTHDACSCVYSS